ncbi:MAG: asparagine synthase (glutamine-hydrolyzing) [Polyangiaceae bacterium]|nr:asparagine synthase (glutamine-hydrolyzing) [Polyangiaceae bacterium]
MRGVVCGIVGIVSNERISVEALTTARDTLSHRGRDDSGTWLSPSGRAALAHRRLSILDLSSAGRQPLLSAQGRLAISYNGEIYNFAELRRDLQGFGHSFRTNTDTEVVLAAYDQWGPDCVRRFRGMFAFAIWDERKQELFIARDRLGIKPLYYYHDGTTFAFASELKAIERLSSLTLVVDETALYDFLTYMYIPAPKTPYTNVRKVLPAHTLTLSDGRLTTHCYWDVAFDSHGGPKSEKDAVEGVTSLLRDAVRSHLVADVPVGCLLSGGVDSSGVTAIAQEFVARPLQTFSIGFDVASQNETLFAREIANKFRTEHTEYTVSAARAKELLGRLPGIYDEPFGDSSAIPTFAVCELAKRSVTVALSGDGGDEVFGGYTWYERHRTLRSLAHLPDAFRELFPFAIDRSALLRLPRVPAILNRIRSQIERHVLLLGGFSKGQKATLLTPEMARRYRDYDDYWYFKAHWRADLPLISRLQYLDLHTYLPDDILTKVDRASMALGLELRPPLIDHPLLEFVASVPAKIRVPPGRLKHLLKMALREVLPRSILERPKQGFSVPLAAWAAELRLPAHRSWSGTVTQSWLTHVLATWERAHNFGGRTKLINERLFQGPTAQ